MGQLGQAPESAQNAWFLHKDSSLKVIKTGSATITVPNSMANDFSSSITVTHNLGYAPAYIAYVIPPSGYSSGYMQKAMLPFFDYLYFDSSTAQPGYHVYGIGLVSALTTSIIRFNLAFVTAFGTNQRAGDWVFKYYLFAEAATI